MLLCNQPWLITMATCELIHQPALQLPVVVTIVTNNYVEYVSPHQAGQQTGSVIRAGNNNNNSFTDNVYNYVIK